MSRDTVFTLPQESIRNLVSTTYGMHLNLEITPRVMTNNWLIFERGYGLGFLLIKESAFFQSLPIL